MFSFDKAVECSDDKVFQYLGITASITPKGDIEPLPNSISVLYDNEFRIQGEEGHFANTYGGRSDGLTTNSHFLQFRKKELQSPSRGMRFDLIDGRSFIIIEPVDEDQFTVTYAATVAK